LLGPLAFSDVLALCDGGSRRRAVFIVDGGRVPEHRAHGAVGAQDRDLDDLPALAGARTRDVPERLLGAVFRKEDVEPLADDLPGASTRQLLECMIESRDPEVRVPDDDRRVGVAEKVLEIVAGLAQIIFRLLAFGGIGEHRDEVPRLGLIHGEVEVQVERLDVDVILLRLSGRGDAAVELEKVRVRLQVTRDDLGDKPSHNVLQPREPTKRVVHLEVLQVDRLAGIVEDHPAIGEAFRHLIEEPLVVFLAGRHLHRSPVGIRHDAYPR
jgi:hypothetical protein